MKLYKHTNGTCNASGPAIRALRERAGISQEQLAAKLQLAGLNLNQKAVSRIETGALFEENDSTIFFGPEPGIKYEVRRDDLASIKRLDND